MAALASFGPSAHAKIRGGSTAEYLTLLKSYDHDAIQTGWNRAQEEVRTAALAGLPASNDLTRISKGLLHRLKTLHFVEKGMPVEDFEQLNDWMGELDILIERISAGDDTTDELVRDREESKKLSLKIKQMRQKYTITDPRQSGLTEAEQEQVRDLRAQLREGVSQPLEAKRIREELDKLYLKHSPRVSVSALFTCALRCHVGINPISCLTTAT